MFQGGAIKKERVVFGQKTSTFQSIGNCNIHVTIERGGAATKSRSHPKGGGQN